MFEPTRSERVRWRIENEVLDTLENRRYEYGRNCNCGSRHLSSTSEAMTMLAFLVDRVQEQACRVFAEARTRGAHERGSKGATVGGCGDVPVAGPGHETALSISPAAVRVDADPRPG